MSGPSEPTLRSRDRLLVPLVLAATAVSQSAALRSGFQHDDFLHLYATVQQPFLYFLVREWGEHVLASFNLLLWLLYHAFGMHALGYLAVGLLLHLANTALLYLLVRRLTRQPLLAAVFAGLWGMAPNAQGCLGWISVHGHLLATTAILVVLVDLAGLAERRQAPTPLALARWCALLLVAASSFGTGLGVAVALPLAVWLLLPAEARNTRTALWLAPLSIALPLLYARLGPDRPGLPWPVSSIAASVAIGFSHLASYGIASLLFSPIFAVTADQRAAWGTLDIDQAVGFSYVVAIPAAVFAAWVMKRSDRETRRQLLGLLLLAGTAYGVVARGRAVYPFVTRAEVATFSRYHYLAPALLAAAFALAAARAQIRLSPGVQRGAAALAFGLPLLFDPGVAHRMSDGAAQDTRKKLAQTVARLESAVARAQEGGDVYLRNRGFAPARVVMAISLSRSVFPGVAAFFAIAYPEGRLDGRKVHFVEEDAAIVEQVRSDPDSPMARLLVTPEEARAAGAVVLDVFPSGVPAPSPKRRGGARSGRSAARGSAGSGD